MRLLSYRDRPMHLGPCPLERLRRTHAVAYNSILPPKQALCFTHDDPELLTCALSRDMAETRWAHQVQCHFKDEDPRASLMQTMPEFAAGGHVYSCGAPRFMGGAFKAVTAHGWSGDALHREYFSFSKADAWVNRAFALRLKKSGRRLHEPFEHSAIEVLAEAGVAIDVKCSDGCDRPGFLNQ
jgi:hypothetical protein